MFSVLQINKYPLDFRIEKQKIDKKKSVYRRTLYTVI